MRPTHLFAVLCLAATLAACGANPQSHINSTTSNPTSPTSPPPPSAPTTPTAPTNPANLIPISALTANNTSGNNSFGSQTNGNLGVSNISKTNVHSLLYAGAQTKVLAHLMMWWGQQGHINIGYSSNDAAQVHRQISDMVSRGIDGVIVDWYGPNNAIDLATQLVMHEAEKHTGFTFAIMVDAGAMGYACSGCSREDALTKLLQYVEQTYFPSPAYMTIQGQPVVTNFSVDSGNSINWQQVNAQLHTPPRFLFQDGQGFSHPMSDGSYSWVRPLDQDRGMSYLTSFYDTGLANYNKETVGASYKGFNDALASWGSGRVMDQQCGQTWLQTFSRINNLYSAGKQLPYLQLVTWNDYEEGTEIETGIDSCFSLEASVSGNTLEWSTNGDEDTVDHYAVYSSTDGQNLAPVTQTQPGVHSVDLCSVELPAGNQQLFVQAVGKPMLTNRLPPPVSYKPACGNSH